MLNNFKIIDRNRIQLNFLFHKIVIQLPKQNRVSLTDWTNRFVSAYLKLRRGAMINPMNSEEIFGRVFKANKTPLPLSSLIMSVWSWEIKESNLSPWDFTAILNLTGLLNKVSIINSKVTVIRNRMFYNFLEHFNTNLKVLIIENVEFFITNNIISPDQKEEFDIIFLLNLYNINLKSYLLYYILDKTKLLYSLEQIHIKQEEDKV